MILIVLVILVLVGMPFFAAILAAAMTGYWQSELNLTLIAMEFARIIELPVLAAVPLFVFSGMLFAHSATPRRLAECAHALGGRVPGGMVVPVLVILALAAAFSGTAGMALLALGSLFAPLLLAGGDRPNWGTGLIHSAPAAGVLLAPSLPLIVYAVVARRINPHSGIAVEALFLAGLLPALLVCVLLGACAMGLRAGRPADSVPRRPVGKSVRSIALELPLPVVVLGGIYTGWLQVVDAGVICATWLLVTTVLIRREIGLGEPPRIMTGAMVIAAAILLIVGSSLALTNIMLDSGLPRKILGFIQPHVGGSIPFLALAGLLLLIAGKVFGVFAAVVVLAPLLIPVGIAFGVDPVHLGIVMVLALQLGALIGTTGAHLSPAGNSFGHDTGRFSYSILPFIGVLFAALVIIACWPALSLWLLT